MKQLEHVSTPGSYKEWTSGTPYQDWEKPLVNTCHFLGKRLGMKCGCHCISLTVIVQNALTELARGRSGITSLQELLALGEPDTAPQGTFQCFAKLFSHATTRLLPAAPPLLETSPLMSLGLQPAYKPLQHPGDTFCGIALRNVTLEIGPSFNI